MIRIENLRKEYDAKTVALDNIDLVFEDSTFVALLGPSGCGKTTTLNCIAGLLEPTSGKIFFGDRDVTRLQPKDRNIGMVFQSYALYPHLKVIDNIAFPLKQKGMKKAERYGDYPIDDSLLGSEIAELRAEELGPAAAPTALNAPDVVESDAEVIEEF